MRLFFFTLGIAALLTLTGCAKPVPPERVPYVGEWQSSNMTVLITQEGRVVYKRLVDANVTKSLDAPLQSFEEDNFIVGVGPLKTTFVVSAPPHEENGNWKMTVDGVALTRK